jgi:hypothetical protein
MAIAAVNAKPLKEESRNLRVRNAPAVLVVTTTVFWCAVLEHHMNLVGQYRPTHYDGHVLVLRYNYV